MIPMFVYQCKSVLTKWFGVACLSLALFTSLVGQIIHLPSLTVVMRCDLELSLSSLNRSCDGADACLHIKGGTPPYTIRFSNDDGTNPSPTESLDVCFPNLQAGVYTIKVEDDEGCTAGLTLDIPAIDYFIPAELQHVNCAGGSDGAIDLNIEIDLAPLYFSWEGPNGFSSDEEDIDGLAAGIYGVSISTTDNVCVGIGSWVVQEPDPIQIDVRIEQPECGQPDGCVYVSGGTAPYYIWVFDVVPDVYADATNGTITDWSDLDPANGFPYNPSTTDGPAFCATDVADGVYYVFVVDSHFCYAWERVEIEGNPGFVREVDVRDVACGSATGGAICFKIDGGTPPYATTISPSVTDEAIIGDNGCFDNLAPGSYLLRTVDATGCSMVKRYEVKRTGGVEAKLEITSPACSGQIDACLYVRGGEQPYRIFVWYWPNAPFAEPQISFTTSGDALADGAPSTDDLDFGPNDHPNDYRRCVENVTPGYYVIVVVDANGCYDVIRTQLYPTGGLDLSSSVADVRCYAGADGSIELKIDGGFPPYAIAFGPNDYRIIDGNYIAFNNLSAGTYQIKVEDRQGCSARTEITIHQPDPITAEFEITSPPCSGRVDGCLRVYGGTFPYNIWVWRWNNVIDVEPHVVFDDNGNPRIEGATPTDEMNFGPNTANVYRRCAEDIPPGTYLVLVVDANRCYDLIRVHIPASNGIELAYEVEPASCTGEDDGKIHLKISGGEAPYTLVLWDGVSQLLDGNEITFQGLPGGVYPITVIDAHQCTAAVRIEVPGGEGLETVLDFDPYGSYACVEVLNGTAPYEYSWYNFSSNEAIGTDECVEELGAGAYWVAVVDEAGCTATDVLFIDVAICQGGVASVTPRAIRSGATTTFYLENYHGEAMQWQFRTRDTDWLNIPGATAATYETPPMYAGSDRIVQIRAVVFCADGEVVYSSSAEFKIYGHVALTQLEVGLLQDRRLFDPALQYAARKLLGQPEVKHQIQVFPTIATDLVNIQFPRDLQTSAHLWLSNVNGKQIRQLRTDEQSTKLDVSALLPGIYFLKMEYNGQVEVQRIVVP